MEIRAAADRRGRTAGERSTTHPFHHADRTAIRGRPHVFVAGPRRARSFQYVSPGSRRLPETAPTAISATAFDEFAGSGLAQKWHLAVEPLERCRTMMKVRGPRD